MLKIPHVGISVSLHASRSLPPKFFVFPSVSWRHQSLLLSLVFDLAAFIWAPLPLRTLSVPVTWFSTLGRPFLESDTEPLGASLGMQPQPHRKGTLSIGFGFSEPSLILKTGSAL